MSYVEKAIATIEAQQAKVQARNIGLEERE